MKMTRLMVAASLMVAGFAVHADTLYWQVGDEYNGDAFTYAQVYATQNSDGTGGSAISGAAAMADGVASISDTGTRVSPVISDIGTAYDSSWYFYVELVNYSTSQSWSMNKNYPWSYNDLVSQGYISTGSNMSTPFASGAAALGSTPEPTSGMLLLIGGSLLALRRRRRHS